MKMQQERSVLAALGTAAVWLGVGVLCSGASAANGTAAAWLWQSGTALAQTAAAVAAARAAGLDRAGLGLVRPGHRRPGAGGVLSCAGAGVLFG